MHLYVPLSIDSDLRIVKLVSVISTFCEFLRGVLFLYHLSTGVGKPSALHESVMLVPAMNDVSVLSSVIYNIKMFSN